MNNGPAVSFVTLMWHIEIFLRWRANTVVAESPFSEKEFVLVTILGDHPDFMTEDGICRLLGMQKPQVKKLTKSLLNRKIIEKNGEYFNLAPEGKALREKYADTLRHRLSQLFDGVEISELGISQLTTLDEKLTEYIDLNVLGK